MSLLWIRQPSNFGAFFDDRYDHIFGSRNGMQSPFVNFDRQFAEDPFFRDAMIDSELSEAREEDKHPQTAVEHNENEESKEQHGPPQAFHVCTYESTSHTKDGQITRRTQRRYRDSNGRDFIKETKLLDGEELQYEKKLLGQKVLHEAHSLVNKTGDAEEEMMENIDAFNKKWEMEMNGMRPNALIDLTDNDSFAP